MIRFSLVILLACSTCCSAADLPIPRKPAIRLEQNEDLKTRLVKKLKPLLERLPIHTLMQ